MTELLSDIDRCRICENDLPLGPRPIVRASRSARLLIIGQAPGSKVHQSGIPWDDSSGERLRDWMQLDKTAFYDQSCVAIMPMGFCYPGRAISGGDNPPRPECALKWHRQLLDMMSNIRLTLLVGTYAQARYLTAGRKKTMTDTVRVWRSFGRAMMPVPHPSWRVTSWLTKNPWFERELIPDLRQRVAAVFEPDH